MTGGGASGCELIPRGRGQLRYNAELPLDGDVALVSLHA